MNGNALKFIALAFAGGCAITTVLMWLAGRAGIFREPPSPPQRIDPPQTVVDSRFAAIVRAESMRAHPSSQPRRDGAT